MTDKAKRSFTPQIVILTVARLFLNTGLRMVYPFVPAFSRGLGVPLTTVYQLVTLRNFAGVFSPLFGVLPERYGRKPVMVGTILLFSLASTLLFIWPTLGVFAFVLIITAVAKSIYDPAMQAHVGDAVPYKQRGRALAATELSWAGALLLGAPAVGFLIARQGWQAPFFWLGLLGLLATVGLWRMIIETKRAPQRQQATSWRQAWTITKQNPVIWAASIYLLMITMGNEMLLIVYGDWMEVSFSLPLTSLGLASGVIGGAEIIGEIVSGSTTDRFGKRPIVIIAGIMASLLYLIIPFTSNTLPTALTTLFILFFFIEVTIVSGVPLLTEIVPEARNLVMSITIATGSIGRALGALFGPIVLQQGGFVANGIAAAIITFIGILTLARWVRVD